VANFRDKAHQTEAFELAKDREYFAYFCEPGTGKSRMLLKDAAYNCFVKNRINALIVISPNSVKTNWVAWPHMLEDGEMDEVTKHIGDENVIKGVWTSAPTGKDKREWKEFEKKINAPEGKLVILSINYESLLVPRFYEFLSEFCMQFSVMIGADESTRLGSPGARRTKLAIKLRDRCKMARILSGTPIIKSPMKIYSQGKFLHKDAIGFKSFYAFRSHYSIMGGFQGRQILSYKNLDELSDRIARWSYRKLKKDCLDLPEQVYIKHRVNMTPEQEAAYKTMREEFYAEIGNNEVTATIALTQMLRLQQIVGGYMTDGDKIIEIIPPERNPKLLDALDIIENAPGQVVVWCRFIPEIKAMARLLTANGISFHEFHGGVPERERIRIRKDFFKGDRKVLLGNTDTGGIGIDEFKVADTVIHVSNSFDTEKRQQADDRNHRIGSEIHERITYYDVICPGTVDVKLVATLRSNRKVSDQIMRDGIRSWL